MTAPERIFASMSHLHQGHGKWETIPFDIDPDSPEYVRADLAADPARVTVKPLVWEGHSDDQRVGDYVITPSYGQGPKRLLLARGSKLVSWHDDMDEAKAAAQADYEASILAAIEPQPDRALHWIDGEPPRPYRNEWFIAKTVHGDKVVLRSLPDDWTYDYTTADHTYMIAENIVCWMQFPDSEYVAIDVQPDPRDAQIAALVEALKGIDQTETDSSDGWWETSFGAQFGAARLRAALSAVKGGDA